MDSPPYLLRPAAPADVPALQAMIRDFADFARLTHELESTEADLHAGLFSADPAAEAVVAETAGELAGFALYYRTFSTFGGKAGLYLEDLYVRPAFRRIGIGRALLAAVARIAIQRGLARYEWSVLAWNERAIRTYEACGAVMNPDWRHMRLSGEALQRLGRM